MILTNGKPLQREIMSKHSNDTRLNVNDKVAERWLTKHKVPNVLTSLHVKNKKYIKIERQKQMYLCFWELCLSEALRTPPGQLSSEQEQRKQQNQEPGVGEFSGFKIKD